MQEGLEERNDEVIIVRVPGWMKKAVKTNAANDHQYASMGAYIRKIIGAEVDGKKKKRQLCRKSRS